MEVVERSVNTALHRVEIRNQCRQVMLSGGLEIGKFSSEFAHVIPRSHEMIACLRIIFIQRLKQ